MVLTFSIHPIIPMQPEVISIQVQIKAPVQKVWEAYTLPEHITRWNFAIPEWHCPSAENDLRPGGLMKVRMEARDGSFGFDFEAIYDEIIPLQKISYTMTDGRKATIHFSEEAESSLVQIHFDAESQNPIELQKNGWQAILNNFKQYLEGRGE